MNKILSLIGKALLSILILILCIFFVIWYKMYNDDDARKYTGFKRIKESFIIALLYSIWMIMAYMGFKM
tara:strand:- start:168 stop:374 length:207 start_codon:yes stop_codon:yes gene_type:complete